MAPISYGSSMYGGGLNKNALSRSYMANLRNEGSAKRLLQTPERVYEQLITPPKPIEEDTDDK